MAQRPGYYYLTAAGYGTEQANSTRDGYDLAKGITNKKTTEISNAALTGPKISGVQINNQLGLPTVFDAIRIAGGVTPFSKLNEVSVTRRRPLSKGGGKIRAQLNFLELITEGNESQNIRLFDGDKVSVARSPIELRDQIIKAQTNLSPDFIQALSLGAYVNPARFSHKAPLSIRLATAGGQKVLRDC